MFDGGAGIPVQIDGEKFLILKEEEIIGIDVLDLTKDE
jgi:co-chaperonin GroES (HSP10)